MPRTSPRARRALLQLAPVIVVATLVGIAASDTGGTGDGRVRKGDGLSGAVSVDGANATITRAVRLSTLPANTTSSVAQVTVTIAIQKNPAVSPGPTP